MDPKKKIIIVEDNDLYREVLRELINAQADLEVVAEAVNGREAVAAAKRVPSDLILLDLRLPEVSGYDILPELAGGTDAKILVLTILESEHTIRSAFEAGADGYCFKDVSSQELLNAIGRVLAGERYVSRTALIYPGERRSEQRLACDCRIVWSYFNKENLVAGQMLNCSRGGCYFETDSYPPVGATLLLRLEKTADETEKAVYGSVRSSSMVEIKWCAPRGRRHGVGVRYHFAG